MRFTLSLPHRTFVGLAVAAALMAHLSSTVAQRLQGNYTLVRLRDADGNKTRLHGERYDFWLAFSDDAGDDGSLYEFGTVIGNTIGGTLLLDEPNGTVLNTTSWSTRMLPPPRLYAIEVALLAAIDGLDHFDETDRVLRFSGDGGRFTLRSERDDGGNGDDDDT